MGAPASRTFRASRMFRAKYIITPNTQLRVTAQKIQDYVGKERAILFKIGSDVPIAPQTSVPALQRFGGGLGTARPTTRRSKVGRDVPIAPLFALSRTSSTNVALI